MRLAKLLIVPAMMPIAGCIGIKAPEKPIEINLSVKLKREVVVRLQKRCRSDHRKPGVVSEINARPLIAALLLATSGGAFAQSSERAAAINPGHVGEQADGFLGVHGNVPDRIRAEMKAINIKRRAPYIPNLRGSVA